MANNLQAGFARVDITPPLGTCMAGYFSRREAEGVLDPLYASAVAFEEKNGAGIVVSCDLIALGEELVKPARRLISERLEISPQNILIHCTHIHTGPEVREKSTEKRKLGEPDTEYNRFLVRKIADAAQMAKNSAERATLEVARGEEDSISFIRRFKMKDGTIQTNPGVGNEEVVEPVGKIDPEVGLIRLNRTAGEDDILIVNFALHPDIVGGSRFSADYPGHMRAVLAKQLPSTRVLFINGASGDINHINALHPGYSSKGYEYSRKVGTILAAEVLKVYQHINQRPDTELKDTTLEIRSKKVTVPLRQVSDEEVAAARKEVEEYYSGKKSSTTSISSAFRTLSLAEKGDTAQLEVQAFRLGELALVGLPGEIFVTIGRRIKKASPYRHTFISNLTNGSNGYLPTASAFAEGGYEANNNPFTPELEDRLVEAALELLGSKQT